MQNVGGSSDAGERDDESGNPESSPAASQQFRPNQASAPHAAVGGNANKPPRRYFRELLNEGPDRHIELLLTIAIATFSCFQLLITCSNNASTSQQAQRLLDSANRIDDAADSFSGSASKINGGVADAVAKLQAQADKMDAARTSSEKNSTDSLAATIENFHQDQRAWLGSGNAVFTVNTKEPFIVAMVSLNTGKTPALDVRYNIIGRGKPKSSPIKLSDIEYTGANEVFQGTVFPDSHFPMRLLGAVPTQFMVDSLSSGEVVMYVFGYITYKDTFHKSHWTHFCVVMDRSFKDASMCDVYNETDTDQLQK